MASGGEITNIYVVESAGEHQHCRGANAGATGCTSAAQGTGTCVPVGLPAFREELVAEGGKRSAPPSPAVALLSETPSRAGRPNAVQRAGGSLPQFATSGAWTSSCDRNPVVATAAHKEVAEEGSSLDIQFRPEEANAGRMSSSRASGGEKPALLTVQGATSSVPSSSASNVSTSTVSSSAPRSPGAVLSPDTPSPAVADPEAAAIGPQTTTSAQGYFRVGGVLVVRAPARETLECTHTAVETGEGTRSETEEGRPLGSNAVQKSHSCFRQSTDAANGKYMPASVLLQQVFTTAASFRPRCGSVHPPPSLARVSAAASSSSCSALECLPSQEIISAVPTASAQKGRAIQPPVPLCSPGPSSSSRFTARGEPSSPCHSSLTLSSTAASQTANCRSVFPQAAEVEALARHPVMKALGRYIRRAGVVALPTETVYGLGAAATLRAACEKIYKLKRRPPTDPLICHVASVQQAFDVVFDLDLDEDSRCLPVSSAAASAAGPSSTHMAAEVQPTTAAATSDSSLSAPQPPPSAAANTVSAASSATAAAEIQAGDAASAREATVPAGGEGQGAASVPKPVAVASAEKTDGVTVNVPGAGAAAGAGAGSAQAGCRKRQQRRDMRLLVKALADAFWPGPLSIVAPGKILEDQTVLPHVEEKQQGRKKNREEEVEGGEVKEEKGQEEEKHEDTQEEKLHRGKGVALAVTSGTRLVAVRCPCNKYALALTLAAGVPIAAPSANLFGRISPTRAQHVLSQFAAPEAAAVTNCSSSSRDDYLQQNSGTRGQPSSNSVGGKQSTSYLENGRSTSSGPSGDDERDIAQFQEAEQQHRKSREGLPLFSGEDFVLLETDDDDGGCCIGIESTVVKVVAVAGPGDSSRAAPADAEAEGRCDSCYEVQVLRRGVVTLDMLQEALDAAASRHNAAEEQQQQQRGKRDVKQGKGVGEQQQQQQTRRGEDGDSADKNVFTPFPRFVLTLSPKIRFHTHDASSSVSTASTTSQIKDHCLEQAVPQVVSCGEGRVLSSTPCLAEKGTRVAVATTEEQKLEVTAATRVAHLSVSTSSRTTDACLAFAAGKGPSDHARKAEEDAVWTRASGTGPIQKLPIQARASTDAPVDVRAAAATAENVTVPGGGGPRGCTFLPAGRMTEPEESKLHKQPLEAPGMALTHYAPCVPCFLISVSSSDIGKRRVSVDSSRSSSFFPSTSEVAIDACERSTKVCNRSEDAASTSAEAVSDALYRTTSAVCTTVKTTAIECKDSILIDAGKDFVAFAPHFLQYYSLVRILGNLCDAAENKDDADTADAGAAAAAIAVVPGSAAADSAAPTVCTEAALTEVGAETHEVGHLSGAERAEEPSSPQVSQERSDATARKWERQTSHHSTQKEVLSCPWAQAAACSIFETLHAAEAVALKKGAKAIFIHAEPLIKGGEHGLAVFDRLYR